MKRLEALETQLQKQRAAALQTAPEGPQSSSTPTPFDGVWEYAQVGDASPECKIRTSVRDSFKVKGSIITNGGETSGKVKPDGTFAFARPNFAFKGTTFVVRGTLKNGKGVGSWTSGGCVRKLAFEKSRKIADFTLRQAKTVLAGVY